MPLNFLCGNTSQIKKKCIKKKEKYCEISSKLYGLVQKPRPRISNLVKLKPFKITSRT